MQAAYRIGADETHHAPGGRRAFRSLRDFLGG
jgi:hypothetical protein